MGVAGLPRVGILANVICSLPTQCRLGYLGQLKSRGIEERMKRHVVLREAQR